jgi:hypothetical protein
MPFDPPDRAARDPIGYRQSLVQKVSKQRADLDPPARPGVILVDVDDTLVILVTSRSGPRENQRGFTAHRPEIQGGAL